MANKEKRSKAKFRKLVVIIGIMLVVILMVGAGVGLRLWQQQSQQSTQAPPNALPEQVMNLENLRDSGDKAAFESELNKALADQSLSSETRYLLYVEQGHNAMQNKEWQAALDAYGKAQTLQDTMDIHRLLGDTYYRAGDTANAVDQYKKAISLIPQGNPRRDDIKAEYEIKIKQFEDGTAIEEPQPAEEEAQP